MDEALAEGNGSDFRAMTKPMVRKKTDGDEISKSNSGPEERRGEASASIRMGGLLPLILAVMVVAAGGLSASLLWRGGPPPPAGAGLPIGGAFHLVDQDGRPVDQHLLDGKWS